MCGLWQGCFGMVAGEYSEQYQPQDWAWEKSFANPLPARLLFSTTLLSPCSTALLPLFCMLADLMCHYIKYFSEIRIGWIYLPFSPLQNISASQRHVVPKPDIWHSWLSPWHFSGVLSELQPCSSFLVSLELISDGGASRSKGRVF